MVILCGVKMVEQRNKCRISLEEWRKIVDNKMVFYDAMLYAMEGENPSRVFENQEKREQIKTVKNNRLPKKTNEHSVPNEYRFDGITDSMMYEERRKIVDENNYRYTKQQYERMGIKIVEEYDDLFYTVELPDGWEIKSTDRSMWNDVIDDKGRKRISFFYKGDFMIGMLSAILKTDILIQSCFLMSINQMQHMKK